MDGRGLGCILVGGSSKGEQPRQLQAFPLIYAQPGLTLIGEGCYSHTMQHNTNNRKGQEMSKADFKRQLKGCRACVQVQGTECWVFTTHHDALLLFDVYRDRIETSDGHMILYVSVKAG